MTKTLGPGYLTRIKAISSNLKESEKNVINYVKEKPEKIIHLSIAELSEICQISESSIVRFCRRLGYKGYQDLKINIAKDNIKAEKHIQEEVELDDSIRLIKEKIFQSSIQAINDTMDVIEDKELEKAVELIFNAKFLEIYGTGASGSVALDAQHKFLKIGIKSIAHTDVFLQAMSASLLERGNVLLAISHSGNNMDVIHAVKLAKEQGAKVIAITNLSKSPLTKLADVNLHTASLETMFRTDAISSRIAQLAIIDAIYTGIALKNPYAASDYLFKTRNATSHKRK